MPVTLLHAVLPLHTFRKKIKLGLSCTVNISMYICNNLCDEIFLQKFKNQIFNNYVYKFILTVLSVCYRHCGQSS